MEIPYYFIFAHTWKKSNNANLRQYSKKEWCQHDAKGGVLRTKQKKVERNRDKKQEEIVGKTDESLHRWRKGL
jgi:hypothetical protein